jgi:NAD(P)-dependent dehydrogenase (short-subunit alcohol dehydrogenase family)
MTVGRFEGKVAIVTGAAHGIGRATAERLGSEGATVALVDLNGEGVEAEAARLEGLGITAVPFSADVSQPAAVAGFVAETLSRFGHIDVLHNNAGGSVRGA